MGVVILARELQTDARGAERIQFPRAGAASIEKAVLVFPPKAAVDFQPDDVGIDPLRRA